MIYCTAIVVQHCNSQLLLLVICYSLVLKLGCQLGLTCHHDGCCMYAAKILFLNSALKGSIHLWKPLHCVSNDVSPSSNCPHELQRQAGMAFPVTSAPDAVQHKYDAGILLHSRLASRSDGQLYKQYILLHDVYPEADLGTACIQQPHECTMWIGDCHRCCSVRVLRRACLTSDLESQLSPCYKPWSGRSQSRYNVSSRCKPADQQSD